MEEGPAGVKGNHRAGTSVVATAVAVVVVDGFSACIGVVVVVVVVVDGVDASAPSGGGAFQCNFDHDKEKVPNETVEVDGQKRVP